MSLNDLTDATRGNPLEVVERLAGEIDKALALTDMKERLAAMGSEPPTVRTPKAFTDFVERERRIYAALVKRSGATPD